MLTYESVLYWSSEDGLFIAEVPEFLGARLMATPRRRRCAASTTRWDFGSTLRESGAVPYRSPRASV